MPLDSEEEAVARLPLNLAVHVQCCRNMYLLKATGSLCKLLKTLQNLLKVCLPLMVYRSSRDFNRCTSPIVVCMRLLLDKTGTAMSFSVPPGSEANWRDMKGNAIVSCVPRL